MEKYLKSRISFLKRNFTKFLISNVWGHPILQVILFHEIFRQNVEPLKYFTLTHFGIFKDKIRLFLEFTFQIEIFRKRNLEVRYELAHSRCILQIYLLYVIFGKSITSKLLYSLNKIQHFCYLFFVESWGRSGLNS